MRTDHLIGLLSSDDRPPARIGPRLVLTMAAGLAVAGLTGLWLLGVRPDLAEALRSPPTAMKWLLPLAVAGAGLLGALDLTRPERSGRGGLLLALVTAGAAMLWLAQSVLSLPAGAAAGAVMGQSASSCLLAVTLMGAPALAAALLALREGASVAPARSGALAGLSAGGFAAAIYALHCDEDAPQFFLTWYSAGIAILVALGAAIGARILRW